MLILNLQEPVSHVVARPSPNDILEWRKYILISNLFSETFLAMSLYGRRTVSSTAVIVLL